MQFESVAPLARVTRSGFVESVHSGCIVVVDTDGQVLHSVGDPNTLVFWRSAAKLHQAVPLILAGGREKFGFSSAELAIMCASHAGAADQICHVETALQKLGLGPEALHCGIQEPYAPTAVRELICRDQSPTTLHNTCSGNHTGLLALNRLLGGDLSRYEAVGEPVQQRALEIVAKFAGLPANEIQLGIDGCSIPSYRTPLRALALAYARLLATPADWPLEFHAATKTITDAVTGNPYLISAYGEPDCQLMRAFGHDAVAKTGAEGICAAAFRPSLRWPRGVGLAIKVADGLGTRARDIALAACVEQLELGTPEQRATFSSQIVREVKSRRGQVVGKIEAAFTL